MRTEDILTVAQVLNEADSCIYSLDGYFPDCSCGCCHNESLYNNPLLQSGLIGLDLVFDDAWRGDHQGGDAGEGGSDNGETHIECLFWGWS